MKCAVYRKPPEFCQHHLFPCLMGVGSKEKKLYDHWKSNREQSEAEQTFKKLRCQIISQNFILRISFIISHTTAIDSEVPQEDAQTDIIYKYTGYISFILLFAENILIISKLCTLDC